MHCTLEQEVAGLHQQYGAALLRFAAGLAGCPELAQDALQEVFLRYFIERRYGREIPFPRAWLYEVLRNYLLDRLKAFPAGRQVDPACLESLAAPRGNPEEALESSEAAARIARALSPRELDCLRLRARGLSYNEVAATMDIRPGTVGALLARVQRKLRTTSDAFPGKGPSVPAGAIRYLLQGAPIYPST